MANYFHSPSVMVGFDRTAASLEIKVQKSNVAGYQTSDVSLLGTDRCTHDFNIAILG